MKCLSLWQPWATFIQSGDKRVETRSWRTDYRGLIAIHAAKHKSRGVAEICEGPEFKKIFDDFEALGVHSLRYDEMYRGGLICVVKLLGCLRTEIATRDLDEKELALGDYSPGRWAWFLGKPTTLNGCLPLRAYQGLFNLSPDVEAKVRNRMR